MKSGAFCIWGMGHSECVARSEDAEASVEVQLGVGGLPRHANRLGVGWSSGYADVAQSAEERRGDADTCVDVVVGESVPQRRECVGEQRTKAVVEVLGEILSSFVQRSDEVGVAMSPSVDGFTGDVGSPGGLGVGGTGEQRLERPLLPWGDGR